MGEGGEGDENIFSRRIRFKRNVTMDSAGIEGGNTSKVQSQLMNKFLPLPQ